MKLTDTQTLYVRSMGKALQVTAIFTDVDECNKWLERNKDDGVVAVFEPFILTADLHDRGVAIN